MCLLRKLISIASYLICSFFYFSLLPIPYTLSGELRVSGFIALIGTNNSQVIQLLRNTTQDGHYNILNCLLLGKTVISLLKKEKS